jgi:dihydrofolate reductase
MKHWAIIVAKGKNNEIGKDNDLLWRISDDLKRFKSITTGHTIVMGRKTFDSLPKGALPNRRNIVLSHTNQTIPNAEVYTTIDAITAACEADEKVFIIGGASLYQLFIDKVERLFLTQLEESFSADVFFPEMDMNDWEILYQEAVEAGDKNEFSHVFYELKRKR